jgi:hypothetical protein
MYKIAISGKANSGKDTVAKLMWDILKNTLPYSKTYLTKRTEAIQKVALADPIKEMILLMFPRTQRKMLYGPSKFRSTEIPGAFKDGQPLTYRKLLQELGTTVGRGFREDVWIDALNYKMEKAENRGYLLFIVTDVRFRNEFDSIKKSGYTMIRVKRDEQLQMNHSSEVEQESILDNEFDFILDNNGTKDDLRVKIVQILNKMPP